MLHQNTVSEFSTLNNNKRQINNKTESMFLFSFTGAGKEIYRMMKAAAIKRQSLVTIRAVSGTMEKGKCS